MICPACKYEHREAYGKKIHEKVIGAKGEFFYQTKRFRRDTHTKFSTTEKADCYGCPNCGNVFIEVTRSEPWYMNNEEISVQEPST